MHRSNKVRNTKIEAETQTIPSDEKNQENNEKFKKKLKKTNYGTRLGWVNVPNRLWMQITKCGFYSVTIHLK